MTSLETYLRELREARPMAVSETSYYRALARDIFRRIAALLLLEPALDENYAAAKRDAYAWP